MWSVLTQMTQAAVVINEIAWMGTDESYLCEWIELYNNGTETVSLADWYMQIGDGPVRAFAEAEATSYTIAPNQYYVIERLVSSCPDPVPGQSDMRFAFGTISNTETSITLMRSQSSKDIEDMVTSGEEWSALGGDNESKATAQYSSTGWFTAPATPGARNVRDSTAESKTTEESTGDDTDTSNEQAGQTIVSDTTKSSSKESPRDPHLSLQIDKPATIYQDRPADFTFVPSGLPDTLLSSLVYRVNFGDMSDTTVGHTETSHTYEFAGEYALVVTASFKEYEATAQTKITVLPIPLEVTKTEEGDIQLHNSAPYEVDISGYAIQANKMFHLPAQTILLPRATVSIAAERVGGVDDYIFVRDREHTIVTSLDEGRQEEVVTSNETTVTPTVAGAVTRNHATETMPRTEVSPQVSELPTTPSASNTSTTEKQYVPYFLLIALLALSVFTLYATSRDVRARNADTQL